MKTVQGTALEGSDYVAVDKQLAFGADEDAIQFFNITIIDDNNQEVSKNFTVSLTSLSSLATLGTISTSTITILDNDGMRLCRSTFSKWFCECIQKFTDTCLSIQFFILLTATSDVYFIR